MEHILFVIVFTAVFFLISKRQTSASKDRGSVHSSRRVPVSPFDQTTAGSALHTRPKTISATPAYLEGGSVTGYQSVSQHNTSIPQPVYISGDKKSAPQKISEAPKQTSAKQEGKVSADPVIDHYTRWRQAVIDTTILTPLHSSYRI